MAPHKIIAATTTEALKLVREQVGGDALVLSTRDTPEGVEIESSISYGSSDHPDSPHYDDQMEIYTQSKTKKMTFDKKEIFKNAERIYHPK